MCFNRKARMIKAPFTIGAGQLGDTSLWSCCLICIKQSSVTSREQMQAMCSNQICNQRMVESCRSIVMSFRATSPCLGESGQAGGYMTSKSMPGAKDNRCAPRSPWSEQALEVKASTRLPKQQASDFAMGSAGQAMELFEKQELWDNLILCCQLLGKKPQAISLIHCELQVRFCGTGAPVLAPLFPICLASQLLCLTAPHWPPVCSLEPSLSRAVIGMQDFARPTPLLLPHALLISSVCPTGHCLLLSG